MPLKARAAGPLFGISRVQIFQKGVQQDMKYKVFVFQAPDPFLAFQGSKSSKKGSNKTWSTKCSFSRRWTPFCALRGPDPSKRGPAEPDLNTPMDPAPFSFLCWHLKTLVCLHSEASVARGACQETQTQRQPSWFESEMAALLPSSQGRPSSVGRAQGP